MKRRAILIGVMALMPMRTLAQTHKFFFVNALGNGLLLEDGTGYIELENCTPNWADNNCWILEENNNPGH